MESHDQTPLSESDQSHKLAWLAIIRWVAIGLIAFFG